jgi:hypothetical protein
LDAVNSASALTSVAGSVICPFRGAVFFGIDGLLEWSWFILSWIDEKSKQI